MMHHVRLYTPSKTAMQSGKKHTNGWVLEIVDPEAKRHDPVMGWTSSTQPHHHAALGFDSLDDAMRYCNAHNLVPTLVEGNPQHLTPKSYADNFTKGFRH